MAVSGSVSLELLHYEKPTVIVYHVGRLMFEVMDIFHLIKVKYITLVNLLADPQLFDDKPQPFDPAAPGADLVPFPEYAAWQDKSPQVAAHVVEWLRDGSLYQERVDMLRQLKREHGSPGASARAAAYIAEHVQTCRMDAAPQRHAA